MNSLVGLPQVFFYDSHVYGYHSENKWKHVPAMCGPIVLSISQNVGDTGRVYIDQ